MRAHALSTLSIKRAPGSVRIRTGGDSPRASRETAMPIRWNSGTDGDAREISLVRKGGSTMRVNAPSAIPGAWTKDDGWQ
ncbi:hypothetical protein GCM10009803_10850 [Microbacterium ginsengiterrae]